MFDQNVKQFIFKDYEITFDEKGATFGSVRKVQWIKDDSDKDESKARIEIRKNYISGNEEKIGKGYTFSTEEGPGELAVGLIKAGFGNTKDILKAVRCRDDFMEAATNINKEDEDNGNGEMFDMRDLLMNIDNEEEA